MKKITTIALIVLLCLTVFCGCAEKANDSSDTIGQVSSIKDGVYELDLFKSSSAITDYAKVDYKTFKSTGGGLMYTPAEGAVFKHVDNDNIADAEKSDILTGDMLIITTDAKGAETVYIYHTDDSDEIEK